MSAPTFTVEAIEYEAGLPDLRRVRETVFVQEQGVPLALEWDELDPLCHHVVARDARGEAIGTGRLTPKRTIGRMAVLRDWRGRGVGDALLRELLGQAIRDYGWRHRLAPCCRSHTISIRERGASPGAVDAGMTGPALR